MNNPALFDAFVAETLRHWTVPTNSSCSTLDRIPDSVFKVRSDVLVYTEVHFGRTHAVHDLQFPCRNLRPKRWRNEHLILHPLNSAQ